VRLLLDTHSLLWFLAGDTRLSPRARSLIEDLGNTRLASIASLWEIAIKVSIGKLFLARPYAEMFPRLLYENRIEAYPITVAHIAAVATLRFHHRDPFDRMIVAQSLTDEVPIVSGDITLDAYSVRRIW
jgi:PIN domain nuclease of toxin-antitoxin system